SVASQRRANASTFVLVTEPHDTSPLSLHDALPILTVTIAANAGEEGKLFGSIGTRDIADAVTAAGVELEKSEVRLPEGPLRNVGEFDVAVQLHTDVETTVKVVVVAG